MAKLSKDKKPKMTKEERRAKYTQKARDRRQKDENRKRNRHKICFNCRRKGHTVSECPYGSNGQKNDEMNKNMIRKQICYKCGSGEHSLKKCPKLSPEEKEMSRRGRMDYHQMTLPFATCFICNGKGHLSSQCDKNKNGVYIKGGCCKLCGSKNHLHMNCPTLLKEGKSDEEKDEESAGDVEEFLEVEEGTCIVVPDSHKNDSTSGPSETKKKKKKKAVNF
mmetsp:Transcript_7762/g.8976  ORF Transcript_7762/g.8976 Transcript_7762/m.8976 type:complete len:221 (+) Transcript_7762:68-730(+)